MRKTFNEGFNALLYNDVARNLEIIYIFKKWAFKIDLQIGPTKTTEKPFYETKQGYFEHLKSAFLDSVL